MSQSHYFNASYNVEGQNIQFKHLQSLNTIELYSALQDLKGIAGAAVFWGLGVIKSSLFKRKVIELKNNMHIHLSSFQYAVDVKIMKLSSVVHRKLTK